MAIQSRSMIKAFFENDKEGFILVSTEKLNFIRDENYSKIPSRSSIFFLFKIIINLIKYRQREFLITRQIGIAFLAVLFGYKVCFEAHNIPRSKISFILTKILSKNRKFRLVANCKGTMNYYLNKFENLKINKSIISLHNCYSTEKKISISRKEIRSKLGISRNKTLILHTGSLYKLSPKDFKRIDNIDGDFIFLHIGGNKAEINFLKNNMKAFKKVRFMSNIHHSEISSYQSAADALFYILGENNETIEYTSPVKIFEYLSTCKPIIYSYIGSIKEVLPNSDLSYGNDKESMENAFSNYLNNKKYHQLFFKNLCKKFTQSTWTNRAKKIEDFLRNPESI